MTILRYLDDTGASSPVPKPGFLPVYEGDKPQPTQCEQVVQDTVVRMPDHWVQTYRIEPAPMYTAGEWLSLHGVGSQNQPTLMYLRMKLDAANKQSAKLDQLEEYLQGVLAEYAADHSPRCDWGLPPVSYKEAVKEAMEALQS